MKLFRNIFMTLAVVLLLSGSNLAVSADKISKVLVLPFNIHSEKDLSFLQRGIGEMLSTRLTLENKVMIIGKDGTGTAAGKTDEKTALAAGEKTGADYVLFGSLTVFGESISTDAKFYDVQKKSPLVVINEFGSSQGDVIYHINVFAAKINETVFGRKTISSQAPAKQVVQQQPSGGEQGLDSRKNPEDVWSKQSGIKMASDEVFSGSGEPAVVLWKSKKFETKLKSLAIGDTDGDGKMETIFADDHNIFIYRQTAGKFEKIKEVAGKTYEFYKGIDVADINGNKKAEIFVTAINDSGRVISFVLEWDGNDYKIIADNEDWHYRVLDIPVRGGKILFGQKGGNANIFSGNVHELKWVHGYYISTNKEILPKGLNVYGFNYGDVLNSGQEMILGFNTNEYLGLFNANGNEEWISSEPYGGSNSYLEPPAEIEAAKKTRTDPDPRPQNRLYLPQRILVNDLDNDKKKEVLVVKNIDTSGGILSRVRIFKSGYFECLSWDNVGLSPKWKTRKFSGYISDYTLGDIDNDGKDELVFLLVTQAGGSTLGADRSFVVSWDAK
ncbi:MAG: VCBS repeat-containing protein [Desulfobacteraceae bacterium]|nr:MAG: VCBS repeat-containing protein [Desulfobacteraceae bacterium]RPH53187.1 MAG: VCBS repeat-containing protein [Desulfobacteraceae bacterium]